VGQRDSAMAARPADDCGDTPLSRVRGCACVMGACVNSPSSELKHWGGVGRVHVKKKKKKRAAGVRDFAQFSSRRKDFRRLRLLCGGQVEGERGMSHHRRQRKSLGASSPDLISDWCR
jgi:hypothetical protein